MKKWNLFILVFLIVLFCLVVPATALTLTFPNGGECLYVGNTHKITWSLTKPEILHPTNLRISLIKRGTSTDTLWQNINISPASKRQYDWTILPDTTPDTTYRIEISDLSNSSKYDRSDNYFKICGFRVISPNGGDTWIKGTTPTIDWSYLGTLGSYVKIELLKAGVLVKTISSSTPNDNSFSSWQIPMSMPTGTDYQIRITSTTNQANTDSSNLKFTISTGKITVNSPNGGETWAKGTTPTITWTSAGTAGSYVKIELLQGAFQKWIIASSTPNDGSYKSWSVPLGLPDSDKYRLRITSTTNPEITDISDEFTITPPPSIAVKVPNGGENWQRGTIHTVTWDYTGSPGTLVKITRLQGNVEVGTISASTSIGTGGHGSFVWKINPTGSTGTNCKVRIQSLSQPSIYDLSNNYFTLAPAPSGVSLSAGPFMRD